MIRGEEARGLTFPSVNVPLLAVAAEENSLKGPESIIFPTSSLSTQSGSQLKKQFKEKLLCPKCQKCFKCQKFSKLQTKVLQA